MAWNRIAARQALINDVIICQVEEGMEWVPGPYGAFVVKKIIVHGDEFNFTCVPLSGCGKQVKLSFDGEEIIIVKCNDHACEVM